MKVASYWSWRWEAYWDDIRNFCAYVISRIISFNWRLCANRELRWLVWHISEMYYPQGLDEDYDGSCPCFRAHFTIGGQEIHVAGYCWRVSRDPERQDLYVWGDAPMGVKRVIARALKKQLDAQEWYAPYVTIYENPDTERKNSDA